MGLPTIGADSLLDSDTLSASPAAAGGFPITNLHDDRVFTIFKPQTNAQLDIITDAGLGNTSDVDYFGMILHDLFTQGATLTFAHSPDNIVYTTVFTVVPSDNLVIFRSFAAVSKRYFRARITGATAPVSIGELQWGTKVEVPFGVPVGFDPDAEKLEVGFSRGQSGNIVGSFKRFISRRAALRLPLLTNAFVSGTTVGLFKEFWDNHGALGKGFFFCWNAGNPGSFEKNAFFGVVDFQAGIRRPLRTQLDVGFRDLEFEVVGMKE